MGLKGYLLIFTTIVVCHFTPQHHHCHNKNISIQEPDDEVIFNKDFSILHRYKMDLLTKVPNHFKNARRQNKKIKLVSKDKICKRFKKNGRYAKIQTIEEHQKVSTGVFPTSEYFFKSEDSWALKVKMSTRITLSFSMRIRTYRKNAILFMALKTAQKAPHQNSTSFTHNHPTHVLLELFSGFIRLTIDYGRVIRASVNKQVSNGKWHAVSVEWSNGGVVLEVDGEKVVEALSGVVISQLKRFFVITTPTSKNPFPQHKIPYKWHFYLGAFKGALLFQNKVFLHTV